jgi:Ca2+-binding RTX toxin-like protein
MPIASDYNDTYWEIGQPITYSFDVSWLGHGTFASIYQSLTISAMAAWAAAADIDLQEADDKKTADWHFGWDKDADGAGDIVSGNILGKHIGYDLDFDGILESGNGEASEILIDIYDASNFVYTIAHEIGHALGLDHNDSTSSVMATSYQAGSTPTAPTDYDKTVIASIYGAAGSSDDQMTGTDSGEELWGRYGADTILGGSGDDLIFGNHNADSLSGGSGGDTIYGGQNNGPATAGERGDFAMRQGVDTIKGGAGDDSIFGNHGSDRLSGGEGADSLYGGQENDTLSGGSGNDLLAGNLGNDDAYGGGGADQFVIGGGKDTIYDFSYSEGDYLTASSTRSSIVDASAGALVTWEGGQQALIIDASASDVTDLWFEARSTTDTGTDTSTDTDTDTSTDTGEIFDVVLGGDGSLTEVTITGFTDGEDKIRIVNSKFWDSGVPGQAGITDTFTGYNDDNIIMVKDETDTVYYSETTDRQAKITFSDFDWDNGSSDWSNPLISIADFIFI